MTKSTSVVNSAVEIMRGCFGGTDVLILGEIYRLTPDEFNRAGQVVIDLMIDGKKLTCPYAVMEEICFYGKTIADDVVYKVINDKTE